MVFPLTFDKRRKVDESMKKWNAEGVIYKMLITQNNVIAYEFADGYKIETKEINAIFHFCNSKLNFIKVDYWFPVCIPSISEDAFLNLYFRWLNEDFGLVCLSGDSTAENLKNAVQLCQRIEKELSQKELIEKLQKYIQMTP